MVDDLRTIPDMLHWYDGMLLLPEHFQAAHRRQEMLGGYLARTVAPHGWGVKSLTARIADSKLEVVTLEAVMPDGLVIRYRSDDPDELPLEADLSAKKALLEQRQRLMVHLVATVWSDDITAQDGPEPGGFDRYRSVKGDRLERDDPDTAEGDSAAQQMRERPWLRPILKLHVGDGGLVAPPAKYVALPLARILQNNDGAIVLDRYEPPRPAIGAAHQLCDIGESVAGGLRGKAQFLSEKVQRDRGVADLPAIAGSAQLRPMRQFQMFQRDADNLRSLVRTVPRLEGLLKDRSAHPFTLYLALCDIVGDLAMLEGELNLPEVPAYEHRDPLASYDELERHIRHMLESLDQRFRILPFVRTAPGRFELAFKPADLGTSLIIGAERAKGEPASTIQAWMANAVIATDELLPALKPKRVTGQGREPIERDEALDLSAPPLTSLFRIDPSAEFIDRKDRLLVVQNPDPGAPMSILLYAARDLPGPVRAE